MTYLYKDEHLALANLYDQHCEAFGVSAEAVGWFNRYTQQVRFSATELLADFNGQSLLDLGCGQGDFFEYLKNNQICAQYSGIDLSSKMIEVAKKRYPEANFFQIDFLDDKFKQNFDYIVANGSFNNLMPDHEKYFQLILAKMFKLANKGVSVNLLSTYAPEHQKYSKELFYYDPEAILKYAFTLTNYVKLKHDYLPNDFTIYLYKGFALSF